MLQLSFRFPSYQYSCYGLKAKMIMWTNSNVDFYYELITGYLTWKNGQVFQLRHFAYKVRGILKEGNRRIKNNDVKLFFVRKSFLERVLTPQADTPQADDPLQHTPPLHPPLWTEWQTRVKTLPYPHISYAGGKYYFLWYYRKKN